MGKNSSLDFEGQPYAVGMQSASSMTPRDVLMKENVTLHTELDIFRANIKAWQTKHLDSTDFSQEVFITVGNQKMNLNILPNWLQHLIYKRQLNICKGQNFSYRKKEKSHGL